MGDSDEDWDAEFGLTSDEGKEGEGDQSFREFQEMLGGKDQENKQGEKKKDKGIIGIRADRLDLQDKENDWNDDFQFEERDEDENVATSVVGEFSILAKRAKAGLSPTNMLDDADSEKKGSRIGKKEKRTRVKSDGGSLNAARATQLLKTPTEKALLAQSSRSMSGVSISSSPGTEDLEGDVEDDRDEDWDMEFGIEAADEDIGMAKIVFSSEETENNIDRFEKSEQLSPRLRLLQPHVAHIHKFAKPCLLYDILVDDSHRLFTNEENMVKWLDELVMKHKKLGELEKTFCTYENEKIYSKAWFAAKMEDLTVKCRNPKLQVQCWKELEGYFNEIDGTMKSLSNEEKPVISKMNVHLIYLASKLWTKRRDNSFQRMIGTAAKVCPNQATLLQLMEAETYGHHSDSFGDHAEPLRKMLSCYQHCKKSDYQETEYFVKARALVCVQLYLSGVSPLTTVGLDRDTDFYEDVDAERYGSSSSSSPERTIYRTKERNEELKEIYPTIPISYLKAKIAYALGEQATREQNWQMAERQFFEAIYILDKVSADFCDHLPPIISQLGTACLQRFADVLLFNLKYEYAIHSFDACLECLERRDRSKERDALLRKVAGIAKDNDDTKRAIQYYKGILAKCISEKKHNEVIFVSDILSKIYAEMGRLSVAEEYLLGAYSMLPNTGKDAEDPRAIDLKLKLAHVYLNSFHFERGIRLLHGILAQQNLPPKKKKVILSVLVKAYTKKRWYWKCDALLQEMNELDSSGNSASSGSSSSLDRSSNKKSATISYGRLPGHLRSASASPTGADEHSQHYWELIALNAKHASRFPEAICAIDCAIYSCHGSNLSALGKFLFIRGKILKDLMRSPSQLKFPLSLRPKSSHKSFMNHPSVCGGLHVIFNSKGDLIQECVATLNRAYHYFLAVGDDLRTARAVYHIAEAYLSHLFPIVALQHLPYAAVSRFPPFNVSDVAKGTGSSSTRSKDKRESSSTLTSSLSASTSSAGPYRTKSKKKKPEKKRAGGVSSSSAPPSVPTPPVNTSKESSDSGGSGSDKAPSALEIVPPIENAADFQVTVESMEGPAMLALEICREVTSPMLMMKSYLNMAELRFLQGELASSIAFWRECRERILDLFVFPVVGKFAPPSFLRNLYGIVKRSVRFLMCLDSDIINQNLALIDAFLLLQVCLEHAEKRPIESPPPGGLDISNTLQIHSMKTRGRRLSVFMTDPISEEMLNAEEEEKTAKSASTPKNGKMARDKTDTNVKQRVYRQSTIKNVREMFGTHSELPFLMSASAAAAGLVSEPNGGVEDIAELVWNCLYCVKAQLRKYAEGKQTADDVCARNQTHLRKLDKIVKGSTSLSMIVQDDYDNLKKSYNRFKRLFYVFSLDDFIFSYCPSSGLANMRQFSLVPDLNNAAGPSTVLGQKDAKYIINIGMLSDSEENIVVSVRAQTTLAELLSFLIEVSLGGTCVNETDPSTDKSAKGKYTTGRLFLPFSKTAARNVELSIQIIDCSRNFFSSLDRLLFPPAFSAYGASQVSSSVTAPDSDGQANFNSDRPSSRRSIQNFRAMKGGQTNTLSLATLVKQNVSDELRESFLFPLTGSLDQTFHQCFGAVEGKELNEQIHMVLFAYNSSHPVTELVPAAKQLRGGKSLCFSDEQSAFLLSFLSASKDQAFSDPIACRRIIDDLSTVIFPWVLDILPPTANGCVNEFSPLILVSSKTTNLLPWELILGQNIIRYLSLTHAVRREKFRWQQFDAEKTLLTVTAQSTAGASSAKAMSKAAAVEANITASHTPRFATVVFNMMDKNLLSIEESRRKQLQKTALCELCQSDVLCSPNINEIFARLPFQSPLLKHGKKMPTQRKFRAVKFYDASQWIEKPWGILESVTPEAGNNADGYPVLLFTYADLLEMTEGLLCLLWNAPQSTLLFIPAKQMRVVTGKILKLHERNTKEWSKRAQKGMGVSNLGSGDSLREWQDYLVNIVGKVQEESSVPIVIINA